MKTYLLLIFLLGISNFSIAQEGTITGRVLDQDTKEPLPFATVAAFQGDQLINGATTGDNGSFELALPYGKYRLRVQFLSYGNKQIPEITLSAANPTNRLGDVLLSSSEETLEAVEVEAQAMEMQLSLDKKVFNVTDNLVTKGGTATDILENIPSVAVDVEGNVSLRGSDNVRVLVNGKPSGLTGANALRQLPADMIESIEVITNPSARYEAQGMAGIINIILKKDQRNGLNGSFDVTTGWPHNHGLAANINVRRKAANFFVNLGSRYRVNPGGGFNNVAFSNEQDDRLEGGYEYSFLYRNSNSERERAGWSHNIRVGSDFFLTEKNVLTAAFLYNRQNGENQAILNYDYLTPSGSRSLSSVRTDNEDELDQNLEWSLDYRRTYDEKNKSLSALVQYRNNSDEESSAYLENFFLPAGELALTNRQRSSNEEENRELLMQFDFVDPLPNDRGQWEAGARSSFRRIGNNYGVDLYNNGDFISLPLFTNDFLYEEEVHAAYAQGGLKFDRMSYQAGLRLEYTGITTEIDENVNRRDFLNLFPSVFANYKLNEQASVQASYSRRIRRPHFRQLNPFWTFSDIRSWRIGNPNVNPEFTDSYELAYLHNWQRSSLTASVFYRNTTDGIEFLSSRLDPENVFTDPQILQFFTGGAVTQAQPYNISNRNDLGLELVLSSDLTNWWTVNGSANGYRQVTDPYTLTNENGVRENRQGVEAFGLMGRVSSRMRFKNGINLQQMLFYRAPQNNLQGRNLSMTFVTLGASKEILNRKGTISLNVDDVFNTRKWRSELNFDDVVTSSEFQWRRRSVTLSFNYRLNQDNRNNRRDNRNQQQRQEGGNDEGMEF
ncbi:tonb-dependent receptor [Flammeovirgaceae bacterium 311]|nr:tonb-dependent receptor [Flammeovirgaceae bacterium 311]